jgi:hypothetical protein
MSLRLVLIACLATGGCIRRDDPPAPTVTALAPLPVIPINEGNALTLPAQRHLVRIGSTMLLAIQQDGADGNHLGMFRSDDGGLTWRRLGDIVQNLQDRDTADLVVVGQDVAVVSSFEGPTLAGSTAHDVFFQWWRHRASGEWTPDPPLTLFDSTSSQTAYYRAELAVDSRGRLWVQAFFLQPGGSSTAQVAVSVDGGASFTVEPSLATTSARGGGRILALGSRMIFIWGIQGIAPALFRTRGDGDPPGSWGPTTTAFSEGIYHGAALSAVTDGAGGMHLFYKDESGATLWYRHFDGVGFGPATLVEDVGAWELEPAATRIGSDVVVFYNRVIVSGTNDEVRVRTLHAGALSAPTVLDSSGGFKGYPAAAEVLPTSVTSVPGFFCDSPTGDAGFATLYRIGFAGTPVDAGAPPDLKAPADLKAPPDLAMPPSDLSSPSVFVDDFTGASLGPSWDVVHGAFSVSSGAALGTAASSYAFWVGTPSANATVGITLGAPTAPTYAGVTVRGDPAVPLRAHYAAYVAPDSTLDLARRNGYVYTYLANGPKVTTGGHRITLTASGFAPVTLTVALDGVPVITTVDSSAQALPSGRAGIFDYNGTSRPLEHFTVGP